MQGMDDKKTTEAYLLKEKELVQEALELETKNKEILIIYKQMEKDITNIKSEKNSLDLEIQNLKLKNIEILNNKESSNEEYSNLKALLGL
jgi:transcription initiation factor IIF auxiliary subunit